MHFTRHARESLGEGPVEGANVLRLQAAKFKVQKFCSRSIIDFLPFPHHKAVRAVPFTKHIISPPPPPFLQPQQDFSEIKEQS